MNPTRVPTAPSVPHLALLAILMALVLPGLAVADGPSAEDLEARRLLAESGEYLLQGGHLIEAAATTEALAASLDLPAGQVSSASLTGPSAGAGVFAGLGVIQPKRGDDFAVLSSGVAGTSAPEPGTDFSPLGTAGDAVTLTLLIDAPEGSNHLSFDFNFLSSEFPDYVGSTFNDTFTATLTDAGGSRQIAFASVNSSFFFAASGSRAGGSGFDIFTEDPAEVDTSFGGGLPDAGLTDWQHVKVPVDSSGPITLRFDIRDLGDGILDSAVILDNVVVSSLEALDPNPGLLSGDEVTTDVNRLATGGEPVEGAAADGVTRVLLRTTVPGTGMVEFSLVDASAPEDGGLSEVGDTDRLDTLLVPVEETSEGFQAFAVYLVPEEFNRGGDEGEADRPLGFKARFLPDSGEPVEAELPFRLVRPPVMFIHGLWSNGGTWQFAVTRDDRFDPTFADYEPTNASHFSTNLQVPFRSIREGLTRARDRGIAVTQMDVAGHSMGGILSRNHVGQASYERPNNYGEGDINKLLTLNTPHTGSPLANVLAGIREAFLIGGPATGLFRRAGKPIDEGAIDDLSNGSAAINAIASTPVPSHALVGTGGSNLSTDALTLLGGTAGVVFRLINLLDGNTDIFAGLQHDLIVGRRSQEGGLPASATTVFDEYRSIHFLLTSWDGYSDRVVDLLNSRADGSEFAELPAPGTLGVVTSELAERIRLARKDFVPDAITITAPATGTAVLSGATVPITVSPVGGFTVDEALLVSEIQAADVDPATLTGDFPVPVDFVGDLEVFVVAKDADGDLTSSESIVLSVVAPAQLDTVRILERDPILFGIGSTRRIHVLGDYVDGVIRELTDPSTGTQYLTADSSIATVSPEGVVTATGLGVTTIVARNGFRQDSVSVTVLADDAAPPTILSVTASPESLWPPNGKLETVTVTVVATDDGDPSPSCAITGVTSSAPDDGDVIVTGPLTVLLRAERAGQEEARVYTIEVTCTDEGGNSSTATVDVIVPHDQR